MRSKRREIGLEIVEKPVELSDVRLYLAVAVDPVGSKNQPFEIRNSNPAECQRRNARQSMAMPVFRVLQ